VQIGVLKIINTIFYSVFANKFKSGIFPQLFKELKSDSSPRGQSIIMANVASF